MSRPPCYYCDGTGWNDEAVRVDVDDYRGAECGWCEGTGEAMHSANLRTSRPPCDALTNLARVRRYYRKGRRDDGFDPYLNVKRHAIGRPVLHTLAQRESDLRVVASYRDMLAAQARVSA